MSLQKHSSQPRQHFTVILEHIAYVEQFVEGVERDELEVDPENRVAIERALQIISEAASKLGQDAALYAPEIDWHGVRGLGNHLRHGYDLIEMDLLWSVIDDELIALKRACTHALAHPDLKNSE